ncbi:MAG: hypothetical protein IPL35_05700 [Sphingobacteriales bacterium]|nr:hypothetical protein [Sphingobacteriales bacterium]
MKAHGANASSFADWWAYKMEVAEAIPHNGAILHDMGINVAFNSDDPEMARRLNTEAAKAKIRRRNGRGGVEVVTLIRQNAVCGATRAAPKAAKMPMWYCGASTPYRYMPKPK